MAWQDYYREHLAEELNQHGDIVPPWAKYPDYERYTIGWRMGAGESWLCFFSVFLETLPRDYETRLAYLRRHPPAPLSWAKSVASVLFPRSGEEEEDEDEEDEDEADVAQLRELGLVKSDVAFANWCALHGEGHVPKLFEESPVLAARHRTREFAFWSRLDASKRMLPTELCADWSPCRAAVQGKLDDLKLDEGLLTLAKFFCAGRVRTPWELGLAPSDFKDSFDDDMHYVDAFRLYLMSAFDDAEHCLRSIESDEAPREWKPFIEREVSCLF